MSSLSPGCCPEPIVVFLVNLTTQDQAWSTKDIGKHHPGEANEPFRTFFLHLQGDPLTFLRRFNKLPMFTWRGLGGLQRVRKQAIRARSLLSEECRRSGGGAEQLRETLRVNLGLGQTEAPGTVSRELGEPKDSRERPRVKGKSKLTCVTQACGDPGKGYPTHTESPISLSRVLTCS